MDKVREEGLEERRSWVQQIEENRQRHLEEIQSLTEKHQKLMEEQEQLHLSALDAALLEVKQQKRYRFDFSSVKIQFLNRFGN